MDKQARLKKLKENYADLKSKHNFPDYVELNQDFHIEKLAEIETDLLIREIRRFMSEKFSNYLRFIEALLHPTNAPMFVFSVVKTLGEDEKKKLSDIYKILAKLEVQLIELDITYNEKQEIAYIVDNFKIWQDIKKDLLKVIAKVKDSWNAKAESNGKSYFG